MVHGKRKPLGGGGGAKDRHRRQPKSQYDPKAPMPVGFEARPVVPAYTSKHQTILELVENKDKKKKLEFQVTTKKTPPPGFEFVPIGNPALTTACKELSREKGAMIFIVSNTKEVDPNHLSHHVHRTGHHVREAIAEEARASTAHLPQAAESDGNPEPLPASQEVYTTQANAAILDLFPRIPNTDRQSIIAHAFNLALINQRPKPVGLCTDITLSRRAQLAVLAHIRHTHTRYDSLLKETTWQNARKVVEALCLDHLVKWRGDEETGRDQLDEILQEVVVISDSDSEESEGEDEGETEESSPDVVIDRVTPVAEQGRLNPLALPAAPQGQFPVTSRPPQYLAPAPAIHRSQDHAAHTPRRTTARRENRGFQRYRAWEEAIRRNRDDDEDEDHVRQPPPPRAMDTTASRTPWQYRPADGGPRPVTVIGEAGTVPHSNGFVQPRPFPGPAPHANPPPRPLAHDAPMYPAPERVPAPARHPARYVSPDRLQDFLVRSIEPASPESTMAPSFVRTLPPRQYPVVSAAAPAPYRPVSASPPRDVAMHGEPPADWYRGNPTPVYRQDPPPIRYADPRPPPAVVMNAPPPQRATYNPNPPVVGATPVAAARPQFRMEDRGGFLERVPLEAPPVLYRHPPEAYTDRQYGQPEWQRPVPVYQGQAYAGQPPLRQEYAARQEHPDYRIYERAAPEVQYQAPAERGYYRGRQEDIIVLD